MTEFTFMSSIWFLSRAAFTDTDNDTLLSTVGWLLLQFGILYLI